MKKHICSILVLICAAAINVSAQVKQITSSEFFTSNSKANSLMKERSWRIETKTDTLDGAAIVKSVTKVHERLQPDRERFVMTETVGDKQTRNEFIRIGYMEYRRENNEAWKSKDLRGGGIGSGSGSGGFACLQYTEEPDIVGGIPARKMRQYLIEKSSEGLSYDDMNIWLDSNGFFLKSERVKGLLEPRTVKTKSVVTYEYDPNTKIEAPILNSEPKVSLMP